LEDIRISGGNGTNIVAGHVVIHRRSDRGIRTEVLNGDAGNISTSVAHVEEDLLALGKLTSDRGRTGFRSSQANGAGDEDRRRVRHLLGAGRSFLNQAGGSLDLEGNGEILTDTRRNGTSDGAG